MVRVNEGGQPPTVEWLQYSVLRSSIDERAIRLLEPQFIPLGLGSTIRAGVAEEVQPSVTVHVCRRAPMSVALGPRPDQGKGAVVVVVVQLERSEVLIEQDIRPAVAIEVRYDGPVREDILVD